MKIEHTAIDPESGSNRTVLSGAGVQDLKAGQVLRCAAYRFTIAEVERSFEEPGVEPTVVALLAGPQRPLLGMQVHLTSTPLTLEEAEAAVRHLLMLPRLLLGIDASAVAFALERLTATEEKLQDGSPLSVAAVALLRVAQSAAEATHRLPEQYRLQEASRLQAELVDLLR